MGTKLNITNGNYAAYRATEEEYSCVMLIEENVLTIYGMHCYENRDKETSDISLLCADSLNTYQSTGKLPSELAKKNEELKNALQKMCEWHEKQSTWDKGDNGYYVAKRLINND